MKQLYSRTITSIVLPLAVAGMFSLTGCNSEKKELLKNLDAKCEEAYVLQDFWDAEFKRTADGWNHQFYLDELGRNVVPVAAICRDPNIHASWPEKKTEELENLYSQFERKIRMAYDAKEKYVEWKEKQ